ncbi:MAG: hypothetical protein A2289_06550 [Deltaproteobacteria bacterium RIFOXYA12_FULL_58_15]|nr:MAG: hypothetical protein A2289_06550 [Deltaproteobacteria bacterium RIFOXYA12_FULL_58_15]OGR09468.1 MAG: hypothetical protein A2341_18235 [Deltaproteobacteria bacterium RIFOXYB12_FULL_58_9]
MFDSSRIILVASSVGVACASAPRLPWSGPKEAEPVVHAEVTTENAYDRIHSRALVRRVLVPTRANLDFAAHHANVTVLDPEPEGLSPSSGQVPEEPFGALIDRESLCASLGRTSLTDAEKRRPLVFSALVDRIAKWNYKLAGGLEDLRAAIRSESWGAGGGPHIVRQQGALAYVHWAEDETVELWVEIEMQPWMRDFSDMPDADQDGFPEIYGRAGAGLISPEVFAYIRDEYSKKRLAGEELQVWANELTSYWYPSYNTDLVPVTSAWPDGSTDPGVVALLHGRTWQQPSVVIVGKPLGEPIYTVLLIDGADGDTGDRAKSGKARSGAKVAGSRVVTAMPNPQRLQVEAELGEHGGSWDAWAKEVATFHRKVAAALNKRDVALKALAGRGDHLFFRASLQQMIGGDLTAQPPGKNPLPVIVEMRDALAAKGIDFLFVPVPPKSAIYPEELGGPELIGKIVNPFERKLVLELGALGVEVVDLLPLFLEERGREADQELYLSQDTHWTDRGLQIAAKAIGQRVEKYPWYPDVAAKIAYKVVAKSFTEEGDLPSRMSPKERRKYVPMQLVGSQVQLPDGTPYDDDPDSPIVILGDSFTGVYQRTFCRNAGISAHIAKNLGTPVDLVMSYGGGPNVRLKLMRQADALEDKRLVIWVMAARDLYNYWEDWKLLIK